MGDTKTSKIKPNKVRLADPNLDVGEEVKVQDGSEGTRIVTSSEGEIISDKTQPAKDEVTYYGTKKDKGSKTTLNPRNEHNAQPTPDNESEVGNKV